MIIVVGDPHAWGYISGFLDERDRRPAHEQFDEKYLGGWLSMKHSGLAFDPETLVMTFPGDPPFHPLSGIHFRDEVLLIYEAEFVVILQPDGSWDAARMD